MRQTHLKAYNKKGRKGLKTFIKCDINKSKK